MNRQQAQDELDELSLIEPFTHAERYVHLKARHNFLTFAKFVTNGKFQPFALHRVLCNFLDEVARGEKRKVILACPPRAGKSFLTAQLFPAYILGRNPNSQNIIASYGKSLSREHAMATLDILKSARYKMVFPEVELKSKDLVEVIRLKSGGVSRITSAGANCTGFGYGDLSEDNFPGIALADDLLADGNSPAIMESTWGWTSQQLITRKLPNHAQIFMGTRFHKNDITGRLLAAEGTVEEGGAWHVLNIPAIATGLKTDPLGRLPGTSHWPEYFPIEQLESTRKQIGEKAFQALYQGNPVSEESSLFRPEIFQYYTSPPLFKYRFMACDTAFSEKATADESVLTVFGVDLLNNLYLIDCVRGRFGFPELIAKTKELTKAHSLQEICIEAKASGQSLIQVLSKELPILVTPLKANTDKVTRANAATQFLSKTWIPANAWWWPSMLEQMTEFPMSAHDDCVDSFCHGLLHFGAKFSIPQGTSYRFNSIGKLRY